MKVKSNQQFMLMSFLGILFMVDGHAGSPINFLGNIFPYDSFFMPMFIFISGYFFNPDRLINWRYFIQGKIKNLLLPFLIINIIGGGGTTLANYYLGCNWVGYDKHFLLHLFTFGTSIDVTSPTWFVVLLFELIFIYSIIRKTLNKVWNDIIALIVTFILCLCSIFLARQGYAANEFYLLGLKLSFFSFFFQLGINFSKIEDTSLISRYYLTISFVTVLINVFLLHFYSLEELRFISLAFMNSFKTDNLLLPIITSITGITFYYSICGLLKPVLGNLKSINFISGNTLYILSFHLIVFNLLNMLSIFIQGKFEPSFSQFQTTAWSIYNFSISTSIMYVICGIAGSLLVSIIFNFVKNKFRHIYLNLS